MPLSPTAVSIDGFCRTPSTSRRNRYMKKTHMTKVSRNSKA